MSRIGYGAGAAGEVVGATAWFTDATAGRLRHRRGLIFGTVTSCNAAVWFLGPALGAGLAALTDPTTALHCVGAGIASTALFTALVVGEPRKTIEEPPSQKTSPSEPLVVRAFRDPAQRGIFAANAALSVNYACLMALVPLQCAELGLTGAQVAGLYGLLSCVSILAGPASGALSDAYGRTIVVVPGLATCALGTVGLALAGDPTAFVAAALVRSLGEGIAAPAVAALTSDRAPDDSRGQSLALARNAGDAAYCLAAPLYGLLADLSRAHLLGIPPNALSFAVAATATASCAGYVHNVFHRSDIRDRRDALNELARRRVQNLLHVAEQAHRRV